MRDSESTHHKNFKDLVTEDGSSSHAATTLKDTIPMGKVQRSHHQSDDSELYDPLPSKYYESRGIKN